MNARLGAWQKEGFARRLWKKDPTLWFPQPKPEITDCLGWLNLPEIMHGQIESLRTFAEKIKGEGFRHVVLLGMGGSSLAPEVFQQAFGNAPGYPELMVLDSTHPSAVRGVESRIEWLQTLFLVSSKSGTTTESLSFFRYFWHRLNRTTHTPGRHFAAITDPGTPLERLATDRGFRSVFAAPPDVGGRYSALSVFGLVPAALIGVDVHRVLDRAGRMAEASAFYVPARENLGLALGATLGESALAGRDKVTFLASPSLACFPAWIEQLIAESTGKDGKGIIPVADEPEGMAETYGPDRLFVGLQMNRMKDAGVDSRIASLESAGNPVIRFHFSEMADLGQEFFRWELAVGAAGAVLGIHPFNQPDVQVAKDLAREAMGEKERKQSKSAAGESISVARPKPLLQALAKWTAGARPNDYLGIQAYLAPSLESAAALREIRLLLGARLRIATTLGYGPRFLHSTGQLHKGGPNTGLFLQLTDDPVEKLPVPETDYTFGALIQAQAFGDFHALKQRGRRVLQVKLGQDAMKGLHRLADVLRTGSYAQ